MRKPRPQAKSRKRRKPRRLRTISRKVRAKYFFNVEQAGRLIGLARSQAYRSAANGGIPVQKYGKLLLVPKTLWTAEVRRLLGEAAKHEPPNGTAPSAA
jgi:hypothetical protein